MGSVRENGHSLYFFSVRQSIFDYTKKKNMLKWTQRLGKMKQMKQLFCMDQKKIGSCIRYIGHNYLISVAMIVLIEALARHSLFQGVSFVWDHPFLTLLSALILTAFYSFALLFRRRNFVWLVITAVILTLAVSNCVLLFFRITPLAATDISLITSVFAIMKVYLTVAQMILIIVIAVVVLAGIVYAGLRMKKTDNVFLPALVSVMLLLAATIGIMHIGDETGLLQTEFANLPDAYEDNGYVYCFTRSLFDRGIAKPETYQEDITEDFLSELKSQRTNKVTDTPNIIFLQLESFFDLSRVNGVTYSDNPIPVFSSLRETCQTGYLTVPSVGAGTANTEFEILTGMNLDYFGAGEYPYKTVLQNVTCESMAYNLKELGYQATAIHNNTATFYDRNLVFSNLGFDRFDSIEYMKNVSYNSIGWAKDKILTQQIMDACTNTKEQDFIYAISVQDHGKYPTDPIEEPHISVQGFAPDDEERQHAFTYYVNEVHETDAFLGYLISELNAFEEPVLLVLYGDHLPNIDMTQEEIEGGNLFQTEYVIWTNDAMKKERTLKKESKDLCAYQLSSYVLGKLGINNGILTKFHQKYAGFPSYREKLKTLQYDMLYGEQEVYDGDSPYEPEEIQMGIRPISIIKVSSVGGSVYIMGQNFTESSTVFINDRKQDTFFLNDSTLMVSDRELEEGDTLYVAQTAGVSEVLSQTDSYLFSK